MTVIYVDSLCILNFCVNSLILLVTARVTGARIHRGRILLAGAMGAAYALAVLLPPLGFLSHLGLKLAVSLLLVLLAFGGESQLLRKLLVFWGISFAFAGAVLGLELLLGQGRPADGFFWLASEPRTILLAAAFCYALFRLVFQRSAALGGGPRRELQRVRFTLGDRSTELTALVDTGNGLKDPVTQRPVYIAEREALLPLLPAELGQLLSREGNCAPADSLERLARLGWGRRFRLIPYRALGVEGGLLLALRVDWARMNGRKEKNALVAMAPGPVSQNGEYRVLAGAER